MLNKNKIPKLLNIKWRYEGDKEFIIYQHPITGMLDILNPVASIIFSNCDGVQSIEEICNKIKDKYNEIDYKIIENDVYSFIEHLAKEEILFII